MNINISDPLLVIIVGSMIIAFITMGKRNKTIRMSPGKFRDLVASQNSPVVIRTSRGIIVKTPIYILPYHGVLFYADIGKSIGHLPDGVTIVKDGHGLAAG